MNEAEKTKEQFASEIGQQLNVVCIQTLIAKCAEQAVEIQSLKKAFKENFGKEEKAV